ncbi:MAG: Ig-like domain-containing protein [Candidatus Pacearchaeota archaeon]|jgi:hypothetical protein
MKKLALTIIVLALLINTVIAADIAYIVRTSPKANIQNSITELGYTYDIITDSQIPNTDFSGYSIMIIQDSLINKANLPLDSMDTIFIDKTIAPIVWPGSIVYTSNTLTSNFESLGTGFTEGFTSVNFNAYTSAKSIGYLKVKPGYVNRISLTTGSTGAYAITAYSNENGLKDVYFGFNEIDFWSADSKKLFKNSIKWMILGEDRDGDGIISDFDCNDNNPNVWQNLSGYSDSDLDGYSSGNLVMACSGEFLPEGYYTINHNDCSPNNPEFYQLIVGYEDNDFDDIGSGNALNICSGEILPNGYVESDNSDCNDNNPAKWQLLKGYLDYDRDNIGTGILINICSGNTLPEGYIDENSEHNDCNDEDVNLYTNIEAYLDSDNDLYGKGNLVNVCTDGSIPNGYIDNDLDCDDNNKDINPEGIEIEYNNIDENCDSFDLIDVDNDGYCRGGERIIDFSEQCSNEVGFFGTDCDDNDLSIYPNSEDLTSNCINDAPVVEIIEKIIVMETETIEIEVFASDPEDDSVFFNINDNRFTRNDNIFTWETNYGDKGIYTFKINASDGLTSRQIDVEVEVKRTNRIPVCANIPDISFNEDNNFILNMKDYCNDSDNDTLTYTIENNQENILMDQVGNNLILTSTPDWDGFGIIKIRIDDSIDEIVSNDINVLVKPVNDEPSFEEDIPDFTWNEGENLLEAFDLNDFFKDVDSPIKFNVSGNNEIIIEINNGIVSFTNDPTWSGSETVRFSASDNEYIKESNDVILNVAYKDKPPVIGNMTCQDDIFEDNQYSCELEAIDPENQEIIFSIERQDNLNCSFEDNILTYVSTKDYYGPASCLIRASDSLGGYTEKLFVTQIYNINDAPVIKDYFPKSDSSKIIANVPTRFTIFIADSDSPINVIWYLDDERFGEGSSQTINLTKGSYTLKAYNSDGEFNASHTWNIVSGNINEFSCSEVNGNICFENQTCSEDFLGVYDSARCCASTCTKAPPRFSAIKNYSIEKSDLIKVNIKQPVSWESVDTGETIEAEVEIENQFDDEKSFVIEGYIYDIDKEKVMVKEELDVRISDNRIKTINMNLKVDEDANEDRNYVVFFRAIAKEDGKRKYYNSAFVTIDVTRKSNDVRIETFDITPLEGAVCGDYLDVNVIVKNYGKSTAMTQLKIENTNLNINEKTEFFKLESYDEDDNFKKTFSFKIPEKTKANSYTFKTSIIYEGIVTTNEYKVNIGECKNEKTEIKEVTANEAIKLETKKSTTSAPKPKKSNIPLFIVLNIVSLALIVIMFILAQVYKNKMHQQEQVKTKKKKR